MASKNITKRSKKRLGGDGGVTISSPLVECVRFKMYVCAISKGEKKKKCRKSPVLCCKNTRMRWTKKILPFIYHS